MNAGSLRAAYKRAFKPLENAWKRLFVRGLVALTGGPRLAASPDWRARPYRVLFLRDDRIGDMIMATGIIRAIAKSHPTISLDVLASPSTLPILEGNPHVGRVVVFHRNRRLTYPGFFWRLRRAHYDVIVDGMVVKDKVPVTTLLQILLSGARYRVGVETRRDGFFNLPAPAAPADAHLVLQTAMLAAPFAVDIGATDWRPEIFLRAEELERAEQAWSGPPEELARGSGRRLLVNVASADPKRRWPDERFIGVLRHVRARDADLRILVMGPPDDSDRVARLASEGAGKPIVPALRDAIALVATGDMLFTPDTSIGHAASAFGTQAVVMLLRGMEIFGPYRTPGRNVYSDDRTLESLPVAHVVAALDEMLEAGAGWLALTRET